VYYSKLKFFLFICIIGVFLASGCENTDKFQFPPVYLSVSINLINDPEFLSLQQASASMEITRHPNGESTIGYANNGIIVYNNGDEFYAFDRTCPHDLPASVAISLDGSMAKCPKCGSVYVLPSAGLPASGSVSKYYLKQYHTSYNINTGVLFIGN
jgi:nitrite reductase/ring-hydroxylating ferredoxin subunit